MFRSWLSCLVIALLLLAAGPAARGAGADDAPPGVTIVYQPGLSYANLIVMRSSGMLERQFPKTKFEWRVLSNGDAIRDGFLAGQIQIGAGGAGPFLIGWDRGVGYRLIGSLNEINLWMTAKDPKYKTLKDFSASAKIGMPSPDAVQGILLRMAAAQQLGNAHALDASIVAIQHPLGLQALLGGQLDAHFTSPPFQQQEVERGAHVVLRSYDILGKSTFNSVYTTETFAKEHPNFVKAFAQALGEATKLVSEKPDQVAEILAKDSDGKETAANFKRYLSDKDTIFTTTPHGFMKYAKFMKEIGLLEKVPGSMRDLELPLLNGSGD